MVVGGTALERMIFFFKAGLFLHPKRSAFILTSELTAADERPARSSYLSLSARFGPSLSARNSGHGRKFPYADLTFLPHSSSARQRAKLDPV